MTTAGKLLFAGDRSKTSWRTTLALGNHFGIRASDTLRIRRRLMLDGHQYLIAATGDILWSFLLY